MENGRKWDPSGKNMFDFALKWDYNVEKYWFCREKQRIGGDGGKLRPMSPVSQRQTS